jgi:hypothetical protein
VSRKSRKPDKGDKGKEKKEREKETGRDCAAEAVCCVVMMRKASR